MNGISNPNPVAASVVGLIVYLLLLLVSPISVVHEIEAFSVGFVVLSYALFILGAFLASKIKLLKVRPLFTGFDVGKRRFCLAVGAVISVVMFAYDRFLMRGASLAGDFLERREALVDAGSSSFGVLSAVLLPATYLYLFETLRGRKFGERIGRGQVLLAILLSLIHPAIGLLFGSRSTLLSSLVFLIAFLLYFRERPIGWRLILGVAALMLSVIMFSGYVFLDRLNVMNMVATYSMEYSVYAFTVQPSDAAKEILGAGQNSFIFFVIFSLISFSQYYTHGLLELLYQVSNENQIVHSSGAFMLYIPYKLVASFVDLPNVFDIMESAKISAGAYTSFFGPVHSDFGWYSIFFMLLFGFYSQRTHEVSKVAIDYVPLSILLSATAFFFPVVNFLLFGVNFYNLVGFVVFGSLGRWVCRS